MSAPLLDCISATDWRWRDAQGALPWALGASLLVHLVLVVATHGGKGFGEATRQEHQPLRAVLTVPDATTSLEQIAAQTPIALWAPTHEALASVALSAPAPMPESSRSAASRGAIGDGPGQRQA